MSHKHNTNDSNNTPSNNNNNNNNTIPIIPSQILSLNLPSKKPKTKSMKAHRLRARLHQQSYSEHLRITRNHNHNFKKMTQKIKQMSRNHTCPKLKPLSIEEKQLITNTVKQNNDIPYATNLGKEIDDGHIEFKWKLTSPGPDRLQHLITQMTYRLGEGRGECIYHIGIEDNGHPRGLCDDELIASINTIFLMGKQLNVSVKIESIEHGIEGKVCKLLVKQNLLDIDNDNNNKDNCIRVCVTGNESVGKSTLIGVLTRGKLDDGNGSARMNVFKHRHEIFDGRTSSISHHILGFDSNGIITNYKAFHGSDYREIVKSSTKLITFVDHPGHERYFKTSVFGLTSAKPHYVLLTVSLDEFYKNNNNENKKNNCDQEWTQMLSLNLDGLLNTNSTDDDSDDSDDDSDSNDNVKLNCTENILPQKSNDPSSDYHKYLTLCESINVPLFIVISKSDIDCKYDYKLLPKMLNKIKTVISLKTHAKLKVKLIENSSEAQRAARALGSSPISYIPVIVSSCVNGEGLQILKTFLFSLCLDSSLTVGTSNTLVEFGMDDIYNVDNIGIVTSGIVRSGTIHVNDTLSLGPDRSGKYKPVTVKSIHVRRKDVSSTFSGQMASLCLAEIACKTEIRRGMVLLAQNINSSIQTCYSFEAKIDILNNMSLREGSQPIIHIENIRQSAHILHLHSNGNILAEGENGVAVFTFLHYPEFIKCGMKLIIRKSHGPIAIGIVTKILDTCQKPLVPLNSLQKPHRLRTNKSKTNLKHYLLKWNLEKNKNNSTTGSSGSSNGSDGSFENDNIKILKLKLNQRPIRKRKYKKKKKTKYTLVWRSGLGYENFYPK